MHSAKNIGQSELGVTAHRDARQGFLVCVLAVTTLLLAFTIKLPCALRQLDLEQAYRNYCHTNLVTLYSGRGFDEDRVPYVDGFLEYPVLQGGVMYAAGLLVESAFAYYLVNAILLATCALVETWFLSRGAVSRSRLVAWAASPLLVAHAFDNWDLLAGVLSIAGWTAWTRGKSGLAALSFGLGGAAKLFPAFFLPFVLLATIRGKDLNSTRAVVLCGIAGLLLPNLIIMAWSFDGWLATWTFHASRGLDWETPWTIFNFVYADRAFWSVATLSLWAAGALAAATLQWWKLLDPLQAGALFVAWFLLASPVYSPQYALWILPFLLLLRAPWVPFAWWVGSSIGVFLVRFRLFVPPPGSDVGYDRAWMPWMATFVALRWLSLAICVAAITWRIVRANRRARAGSGLPSPSAAEGAAHRARRVHE